MKYYSSTIHQFANLFRFLMSLKPGFRSLLFLIFILFYSSCQDDATLKPKETKQKAIENPHAKYLRESRLNKQFLPRTNRYTVSQALDYLNDGMNFLYCRPNDYFLESVAFKDTFPIPISSSQISEDDLIDLMDDIAYFAGDHYYADGRTAKEPLIFNMNQVGSPSPSYVDIEVFFEMEAGSPVSTTEEYPYENSWLYARWSGEENPECNEDQGSVTAPALFKRDLRKNIIYRNQEDPFYLINPIATCFDPFNFECTSLHGLPPVGVPITQFYGSVALRTPDDILDNLFDFYIFKNSDNLDNFDRCLDVDEMNFYYESMYDLALGLLPSPAGNNVIAQIEVGWDRFTIFNTTTIWHSMVVLQATKISTDEDNTTPLPCHCH